MQVIPSCIHLTGPLDLLIRLLIQQQTMHVYIYNKFMWRTP